MLHDLWSHNLSPTVTTCGHPAFHCERPSDLRSVGCDESPIEGVTAGHLSQTNHRRSLAIHTDDYVIWVTEVERLRYLWSHNAAPSGKG
jgi:hypothetical protein